MFFIVWFLKKKIQRDFRYENPAGHLLTPSAFLIEQNMNLLELPSTVTENNSHPAYRCLFMLPSGLITYTEGCFL